MHFHWQNLSEDDKRRRRVPFNGRAWWHFGKDSGWNLAWQWVFSPRLRCKFSIGHDEESGYGFSIGLPFFALYVSLGYPGSYKKDKRDLSLSIHDWTLWWRVWADPDCWNNQRPRWRDGSFHFLDVLLGKVKHWKEDERVVDVLLPLPERSYPGTVEMYTGIWKRPRWFADRRSMCEVEIPRGGKAPQFPGKGENSWDCGDDAIYGLHRECKTVPEAVGKYVEAVLHNRERRGVAFDYNPKEATG
ncbi:hypothetical protein LCGC14_0320050 [marine sediment metagenome]|uniref:Uncharacterized protein n=1 Tax=marine sediment metagenome TaxID=412755 RepID=A0A0F9U273_9ZZZZ